MLWGPRDAHPAALGGLLQPVHHVVPVLPALGAPPAEQDVVIFTEQPRGCGVLPPAALPWGSLLHRGAEPGGHLGRRCSLSWTGAAGSRGGHPSRSAHRTGGHVRRRSRQKSQDQKASHESGELGTNG